MFSQSDDNFESNLKLASQLNDLLLKNADEWYNTLLEIRKNYKIFSENPAVVDTESSKKNKLKAKIYSGVLDHVIDYITEVENEESFKNAIDNLETDMLMAANCFNFSQVKALKELTELRPDPQRGFDADTISTCLTKIMAAADIQKIIKPTGSNQLKASNTFVGASESSFPSVQPQSPLIEKPPDDKKKCPFCSLIMPESANFCPKCQHDFNNTDPEKQFLQEIRYMFNTTQFQEIQQLDRTGYTTKDGHITGISFVGPAYSLVFLPDSIGNLPYLESLSFTQASIMKIDSSLCKLPKLKLLYFKYCPKLIEITPEIQNLKSLEVLYIAGNFQLPSIPETIANLPNLHSLIVQYNPKVKIPKAIFSMQLLHELNLSQCELSELPPETKNLKNLTHLFLAVNKFTEIPSVIFDLEKLNTLELRENQISDISEIGKLKNLIQLDLSSNNIKDLPDSIMELNQLKTLFLEKNPIKKPSKSVQKWFQEAIKQNKQFRVQ